MKVVVAGGCGFIGSHICDGFVNEGHEVVCIDNLCSGSVENIKHLLSNPNFIFIEHDIVQPIDVTAGAICNLACIASPPRYQAVPIETMKTNVLGTLNLLELARKNGACFLQASTSEVYGNAVMHPQSESYLGNVNPIGLRACYNEGKRAAESLCFDYRRVHGVDVKVARIFNTYGPRMQIDDGRVIPNFIRQCLHGEVLTIYGTGQQTRSFCYVDDMVEALMLLLASSPDLTGPVNLGSPDEITMVELAETVAAAMNVTLPMVFSANVEDDPERRRPEITRAKECLGWTPTTSLKDGLASTLAWFTEREGEGRPSSDFLGAAPGSVA